MSKKILWELIKIWAIIAACISTIALTAEPLKKVSPETSFLQKISQDPKASTAPASEGKKPDVVEAKKPELSTVSEEKKKTIELATPLEKTAEEERNEAIDNEVISLNFEKTSLAAIVNFLAERKDINIIPHKDLATATISLHNYKPLTLAQAWNMLPTLLEINGFTMNKVGKLYRIVNSKESGREPLPIYSSATGTQPSMLPENDQMIRYIYFLRNIKAENAMSILGSMFIERGSVEINRDLDVLFIKEKSFNIKAAMKIIEELDVSGLRQSIEIIQLNYESPASIARLFNDELLNAKKQGPDNTIRFIQVNKTEGSYFSPNVKIMADIPRNSLILIGQDRDIKKIKDFINQFLDVEPTAETRVHIRDIKYVPAAQVQTLITSIIKPPQGISKEELGNTKFFQDVNVIAESPGDGSNLYGSGNRIIVTCGKDDWRRIEKLINKIDRPRPQIALEVMVIDVSSDASRELGAQLRQRTQSNLLGSTLAYGTSMLVNNTPSPADESSMIDGGLPLTSGGAISVGSAENVWAVIKTSLNQTNSNIIAQPFFVVANRKECTTSSGLSQRVIGAFQNVQGLRNQDEIWAKNSISLTPSINSSGIVDLKINIDFSDFVDSTNDPSIGSPRTKRNINTRATMAEGEVLILGGLSRTSQTERLYQFPVFSSIPILGSLFKSKKKISIKKNLYIFIRPSIVKPEFSGLPDDYTQFKVDYAKHQVFNFQSYGKGIDPIQHFFFKPRKTSISESLEEQKANRFSWIDNFTERRFQPPAVNISEDPYFQQSAKIASKKKQKKQKKDMILHKNSELLS